MNDVILPSCWSTDPRVGWGPAACSAWVNSWADSQPNSVYRSGLNPGDAFWTQVWKVLTAGSWLASSPRNSGVDHLHVDALGGRRAAGVGHQLLGVGRGAEHHLGVEVLLVERLDHRGGVVLGHLLEEQDLDARPGAWPRRSG